MKNRLNFLQSILTGALLVFSVPAMAGITFEKNQFEIVSAPSCNHIPITIPYNVSDLSFNESNITVNSDSNWATPSVNSEQNQIEISFSMEELFASYTATISVDDGSQVNELFIDLTMPAMDIYRLLDDPLRSKTYGILKNGEDSGSIIAFDPVKEQLMSCLTVGRNPTDFVINDDSSELLVINSVDRNIHIIDLTSFSLKETINLPSYTAWGDDSDTTANIDLGPNNIIYYVDGAWGPVLHTLDRSSGEVIQSISFSGAAPSHTTGFMDFAITSDKTKLVAMPQYGWSAGSHSPRIGQFSINPNGTVNFEQETTLSHFERKPFEAPVLLSSDDQIAVMKTIAVNPADTNELYKEFPSAIWSMSSNGSVVATADKLYAYETGKELYTFSTNNDYLDYIDRHAQAFTSDFTRFVYFDKSKRELKVINLIQEIGQEQLGLSMNPANGAVINSPRVLKWTPLESIDQYDVYLCDNNESLETAGHDSPCYLGRVTGSEIELMQTLVNGSQYFWRIDPVTAQGPELGTIFSFTVSDISLDKSKIEATTVSGHSNFSIELQLGSSGTPVSWTATAEHPWVKLVQTSGSTPSTLSIHLDSTQLSPGYHNSSVTLTSPSGELQIPVKFQVEPLNLTHIRSDKNSKMAYAVSENTESAITKAYLLEIDTESEKITRVVEVGSSVTDFAIHYSDNLIYVTNWKSGNLLAIDKASFTHTNSIAFSPAGAVGYSDGDVFRVSAGASQRLVVEEYDQWIDISLFNTSSNEEVSNTFVREGGGEFDPTGRYYYHGENNSSGASIIKFDTSGDVFTAITEIRPTEIAYYYGSRTVTISEDGSRIFWAGVVFDKDLQTEWGIGSHIYSTTTDGRLAFSDTLIFDVEEQREVLTMPALTSVSGYNSTSEKLIVQVEEQISFYPLSFPISIPTPLLSISQTTDASVELNWTDNSLEMDFIVQQREKGTDTWLELETTAANVNNLSVNTTESVTRYEYRVRARAFENSSSWSNIVSINEQPNARDDVIELAELTTSNFYITNNDEDLENALDPSTIEITSQPQFGEITIQSNGEISYIPNNDFTHLDSFTYRVSDDLGYASEEAHVQLVYIPAPQLNHTNSTFTSVELSWTNEAIEAFEHLSISDGHFLIQQRSQGTETWSDLNTLEGSDKRLVIQNLLMGNTYEFRIKASSSSKESQWSNIVSVTLPTEVTPKPESGSSGGTVDLVSLVTLLSILLFFRRRIIFNKESNI